MIKAAFIELLQTKFPHVHQQDIEQWIGRAWSTLLYETYKIDPSNLDFFVKPYEVDVLKDTYGNYYSLLPIGIVQLPDSADGVRRISLKGDNSLKFFPAPKGSFSIFNELDVNLIDDGILYAVKFDKIEYSCDPGITEVKLDLVPRFESYDDEDEIGVPMGFDVKLISIVEQLINGTPPPDKQNG